MEAPRSLSQGDGSTEDHCVVLRGATWADWRRVLEIRGEQSVPRLAFFGGALQLTRPSRSRERIKSVLGRLIEAYCLELGVDFSPFGSWTLEDEGAQCGVEPDECYVFGEVVERARPDLAIEVVWTLGGIDTLGVYRGLEVREVWVWRRGVITPYVLGGDGYEVVERSEVLPGIDLGELGSFVERPTVSQAMRAYQAALVARRPRG